jgi:hypothetical protein
MTVQFSLFVRFLYKTLIFALIAMVGWTLVLNTSELTQGITPGEKAALQLLPLLIWFGMGYLWTKVDNKGNGYQSGNSQVSTGFAAPVKDEPKPLTQVHVNNILRRLHYGHSHLVVFDKNGELMETFKEFAKTCEHFDSVNSRIHYATTDSQLDFLINTEQRSRLKIIISIANENGKSVWSEVSSYHLLKRT